MIGKRVFVAVMCGVSFMSTAIASTETQQYWKNADDVRLFVQDAIDAKIPNINSKDGLEKAVNAVIEATIKAINIISSISSTTTVNLDEWKKAKLVELIWTANQNFQDLSLSKICLNTLTDKLGIKSNFELAKYLIMSQCSTWEETSAKFEKIADADKYLVADAIWKLRVATNGDKEQSTQLLKKLKESGKFEEILGDWLPPSE
jgi:predicted transcriptional regulator YheO